MHKAVRRYDGGGRYSMHGCRRQPGPGEDRTIPALRVWALEMSQGGGGGGGGVGVGGSFRPRFLPVHGRLYFSRELCLSNTGLNPWHPSVKLVVTNKEVEDVFGTSKNPVCLTAARNMSAQFLHDLSDNVLRKKGCKFVSLAFARGAIAMHRGLQVDWATFAFLGQFKGRNGRARLSKLMRLSGEQQGDSEVTIRTGDDGREALAKNCIRIMQELQGRLRRLRRKQSRIEDMLLVLEKERTGNCVQSPSRIADTLETTDSTLSHMGELVEELSRLIALQKHIQKDFLEHIWCNTMRSEGGTNSASLQAVPLTEFVDVKPFATRNRPLAVEEQQIWLLEGPIQDASDGSCESRFRSLAERLFAGGAAQGKQVFNPPGGMKLRWARL